MLGYVNMNSVNSETVVLHKIMNPDIQSASRYWVDFVNGSLFKPASSRMNMKAASKMKMNLSAE